MAEYVNNKEEAINIGEPIIFENKTEASFDVSLGVVFRKSGLYRVSMYGKNVSIQKEPERMRGKWEKGFLDDTSCPIVKCSCCGQEYFARALEYNFCPNCGADNMRGGENE